MMKPGYKQTEIGVIPEDWDIGSLKEAFQRLDAGVSVNSDESAYSDYYVLKTSAVRNGIVNVKEAKPVVRADYPRLKCPVKKGSIIISRMNTPAMVGECGFCAEEAPDTFLPDRLWQVEPTASDYDFRWLNYLLNTEKYSAAIRATATGTSNSMKNIAKDRLLEISIPKPTLPEQQHIAEALSDMDELIASLEKLIVKKKTIKQGTMQELLTGKRRLPGFTGEWYETPIKSIGEIITGTTPSRSRPEYWDGKHAWVSARDFSSKYIANTAETVSDTGKKECRFVPKGSILVTCIASIGLNAIAACKCATNQQINSIICNSDYDNEFVYYQICAQTPVMKAIAGQTAVPIVSKKQFEDLKIAVPPSLQEQNEIGRTLANIDSELLSFRMQLTKVRQIKQGMMQQLLTGKMRLL